MPTKTARGRHTAAKCDAITALTKHCWQEPERAQNSSAAACLKCPSIHVSLGLMPNFAAAEKA